MGNYPLVFRSSEWLVNFSIPEGSCSLRREDSPIKYGETVTFAHVAGVDEVKELEEIVEFLKNPDRYIKFGARSPRGVLLVGLPGTNKTLLTKAVSGEAEVCCHMAIRLAPIIDWVEILPWNW